MLRCKAVKSTAVSLATTSAHALCLCLLTVRIYATATAQRLQLGHDQQSEIAQACLAFVIAHLCNYPLTQTHEGL